MRVTAVLAGVAALTLVGLGSSTQRLPARSDPPMAQLCHMVFPGFQQGREMPAEELRNWLAWLQERDYDVAGFLRREATVDVVVRAPDALHALTETGFVVLQSEAARGLTQQPDLEAAVGDYVDPDELAAFLVGEAADHPDITDLTVIGQTHEGRYVYALEISANPGVAEDKPAILLNGLHHAREVITPHIVMDAITYLTDQYEVGDPQALGWVRNYKIFCVPMVNPDGSNRVHLIDNLHRKNMRPVCLWDIPGVDLNRNYPYHWGEGADNCERGVGSSGDECDGGYRGPAAASEPETQAMIGLTSQQRFLIAVSYHSFGRFIDYPYACNDGDPDLSMPEHEVVDELMHGAADAIFAATNVSYDVYSPIAISPVNGDDTSWYYAHMGTYPLIIETATSLQPSLPVGMQEVLYNRAGWMYLLDRMSGGRLDVRVADEATGEPLVAQVELIDFVFDTDELPRYTEPVFGRYRWLVPAYGSYTVRASADGYQDDTVTVPVGNGPADVLIALALESADKPALIASEPSADGTLPKTQNNVILLTFDKSITWADPNDQALSIVPLAGGTDVGGDFFYTIEPDGRTLRAVENANQLALACWYRIEPLAALGVEPFVLDSCTLVGDANGSGRVTASDYSQVKAHLGELTDARCDLNGSGRVTTADYSVVKATLGNRLPAKP